MKSVLQKLIIGVPLFIGHQCYSQQCDSTLWAQPGTYTVEIDPAAVENPESLSKPILLSGNDLCLIEQSRGHAHTNVIYIGAYKVTIFPVSEIHGHVTKE